MGRETIIVGEANVFGIEIDDIEVEMKEGAHTGLFRDLLKKFNSLGKEKWNKTIIKLSEQNKLFLELLQQGFYGKVNDY